MSESASVSGIKHYQTGGGAGAATLSREERLYSPKALAIRDNEESLADASRAASDALTLRLDGIRLDIADASIGLAAAQRAQKRNPDVEARYEAQIDAGKARLRDEQKRHDDRQSKTAGSAVHYVREFMKRNGRPTRDCNTPVELAPGKSERETMAILRDQHQAKREEIKPVVKAHRAADEIMIDVAHAVDRMGTAAVTRAMRKVRSVHYHADIDKLESLSFELPTVTVVDGTGGLSYVPDGVALLCALDPEGVKQKLAALALAGHDDRKALTMEARRTMINAINADMLLIERKSEALVRFCFANGIEPGPRLTSNPLAILDIELV